jgi:hypothetical protein
MGWSSFTGYPGFARNLAVVLLAPVFATAEIRWNAEVLNELQIGGRARLEETADALVAASNAPLDDEWNTLALVALGLREEVGRWNPPPDPTLMLQLVIGRLDETTAIAWWDKAGPDLIAVAARLSRHQPPPDGGVSPVERWRAALGRAISTGNEAALQAFPWRAVDPAETFRWLSDAGNLQPEGRDRLFLDFLARGKPHDQLPELLWWKCARLASENRRHDVLAALMARPPVLNQAGFAETWALLIALHPACRSLHGCFSPAWIQGWQQELGLVARSSRNHILRLWLQTTSPEQREKLPLWRAGRVRSALALGNAREALALYDGAAADDPEPGIATRLSAILRTDTALLREAEAMELPAPTRRMVRSIQRENETPAKTEKTERAAELRAWLLDGANCPAWVAPINPA